MDAADEGVAAEDDGRRDKGFVAFMPLPGDEETEGGGCAGDEADYAWCVPCVRFGAVLHG